MDEKQKKMQSILETWQATINKDWSTLNSEQRAKAKESAVKLVETAAKFGLTANFTYPGEGAEPKVTPQVAPAPKVSPSAPKPEDADKARFMRQNGDLIRAWTSGARVMREAGFGPGKGKVAAVKAWASDGLIVTLANEMDLLIPWSSLNREVPHALYPMSVEAEAEMAEPESNATAAPSKAPKRRGRPPGSGKKATATQAPSEAPKRRGRPPGSKNKTKADQPQSVPAPASKPTESPKKGKGPNVIKVWSKGGKLHVSSTYPPPYMVCKDRRKCGWEWNKAILAWTHEDNAEGRKHLKDWKLPVEGGEVMASELVGQKTQPKVVEAPKAAEVKADKKGKFTAKPKSAKGKQRKGMASQVADAATSAAQSVGGAVSSVVDAIKGAVGAEPKKDRKPSTGARKGRKPSPVKLPKTWDQIECMTRAQLERVYPAAVGKDAPQGAKPKMLREEIAKAVGIAVPNAACEKKGRVTVNLTRGAKAKLMQGGTPASRRVREMLEKAGIEDPSCSRRRRGCGKGKKAA